MINCQVIYMFDSKNTFFAMATRIIFYLKTTFLIGNSIIFSTNGESSGKIRSTPMLPDILRTVKRLLPVWPEIR